MVAYHLFYWPLALTSLMLLLESQFQNGVLARYPNAAEQLATFALAASSFQLLNAFLVFVPQTVTILARCPRSRKTCRRFVIAVGALLSGLLMTIGFLPVATRTFAAVMRIPPELLPPVISYLRWLAPLVLVNAIRQYYLGVLVRSGKTRVITVLNVIHLSILIGMLLAGRALGWSAIATLAVATIVSNLIHLALTSWAADERRLPAGEPALQPLRYHEIFRFFWPVAVTSGMFAMCRPVMYAFINRTAMAVTTVAALRLAFDAAMFFQNPVNQFRHVYTTFGREDPEGVRRFMFRVSFGLTAAMVLVAFSPLGRWMFRRLLGVDGMILEYALQTLRVLCLVPLTIAVRNLYHGQLMVERRTAGMAAGATLRVLAIAGMSWGLFHAGHLNHIACGLMLVIGFATEALTARRAVMRLRRLTPVPGRHR